MQSKGCLQGNKTTFIATSVLLLFAWKLCSFGKAPPGWRLNSHMDGSIFGHRVLSLRVLAKILPCALRNGFWTIWADLAQITGRKWFVGSEGEGGAGKEWPWRRPHCATHGNIQPSYPKGLTGWMVGRDKRIPTSLNPCLYHPFSLQTFSSGGNWMLWAGFRLPGCHVWASHLPKFTKAMVCFPTDFPGANEMCCKPRNPNQFPSILSFYLIQDPRTVKHFSIVWPQSEFTFYYIDHIFSLRVYDHGQRKWGNKERNKYVYMSRRNYIAHQSGLSATAENRPLFICSSQVTQIFRSIFNTDDVSPNYIITGCFVMAQWFGGDKNFSGKLRVIISFKTPEGIARFYICFCQLFNLIFPWNH